ncbi:MAG: Fe-S protein assembly co-chaperone HscB [Nitrospira sp.]|nr:Fe-S protein assembly co-chaperone HscB [Nitrospira sp.]
MEHEHLHCDDMGQKVKCLSCGSPNEGFFCRDCHTLLPMGKEVDFFTLLEVDRRPSVSLEKLKDVFLKLSELVHPDKYYSASAEAKEIAMQYSSLLNKAYATLKDPKDRLKYLISLETDKETPVSGKASAETMEFFIEASDICNEADAFIKKGSKGEVEKKELHQSLLNVKKESQSKWGLVLKAIDAIDGEWVKAAPDERKPLVRRLIIISHELSYLSKLQSLVDEMIVALS